MDYEKKTKDAIRAIKQALRQLATNGIPVGNMIESIKNIEEKYTESNDEKIRKDLISYIKQINYDNSHTWNGINLNVFITWLEKQGKQKPADIVEPKFKVGDWIVYKDTVWKVCNISLLNYYELLKINNEVSTRFIKDVDETAHLWTIEDAKDGDVLYECNEKKPFIFKKLKTKHIDDITSYCDIFNGIFTPNEDSWTTLDIVPATKEQRDLLFQKMHEAGYEWDAEKKELKKIEQKPWSEEDEDIRLRLIDYLYGKSRLTKDREDGIYWLKSLKERYTWKPSDEQINTLEKWLKDNQYKGDARYCYPIFESLYQDLKKLKA